MKVVDFKTFCSLPDGAVFSYWQPCVGDGLHVRREVIYSKGEPIDFFESSCLPQCDWNESTRLSDPDLPPVLDDIMGRWGIFDYDQLFAVYEADDLRRLGQMLGILPEDEE